jgi:hypothetical protein
MPVDIDKAQEKVEKASGFFDTLNAFIRKHPIWSIIIALVLLSEGGYLGWTATHPDDEVYDEPYYNEDYYGEYEDSTYYYEEQQTY